MDIFQAIITGIIQGITEFIPVSSSAHLVCLPLIVNWSDPGHAADVFLHLGSLFAIFVVFWKEIKLISEGTMHALTFKASEQRTYALSLLVSSLPTIAVFGVVEIFFPLRINSLIFIASSSIFFGALLGFADRRSTIKSLDRQVSYKDALIVGAFQVFSLIPGASRLGTCLTGMRLLGYDRITSFKFSVMTSIVPVAGAVFLKSFKIFFSVISLPLDGIVLSCAVALVFGILTLRLALMWLGKRSFFPFVLYRIVLGAVIIGFYWAVG
ncbi:MAG: undecaprenyl-diphosphate phosphatase [Holosporales bacterium]|jgi:undecaprenyl-diphosphatase|nr:undecaprenyl-diphosphate phosphatase [Holosporales bacterium]